MVENTHFFQEHIILYSMSSTKEMNIFLIHLIKSITHTHTHTHTNLSKILIKVGQKGESQKFIELTGYRNVEINKIE